MIYIVLQIGIRVTIMVLVPIVMIWMLFGIAILVELVILWYVYEFWKLIEDVDDSQRENLKEQISMGCD